MALSGAQAAVAAAPPPPAVAAVSAVLYDAQTGQVLYAKSDESRLAPASITKLMTALVVLQHIHDLNMPVHITAADAAVGGSSAPMAAGETLTVRDLLYGLLLVSGNDAAVALANATAGSVPRFVAMMNQEAKAVGATHSHFVDPNGLPAVGHLVTALDMAHIAAAVLRQPEEMQVLRTKVLENYPMPSGPPQPMVNQDQLLWNYPGILGGKIGYTPEAGNTMVAMAHRGGMTLVAVVLHDVPWQYFNDETALLNYGFANWHRVSLVSPGDEVAVRPVNHLAHRQVGLEAMQPVSWDVTNGGTVQIRTLLSAPRRLPSGKGRGTVVGSLEVMASGQLAGVTPVALAASTPKPPRPKHSSAVPEIAIAAALAVLLVLAASLSGSGRRRRRLTVSAPRRKRRYRLKRDSVWLRLAGGSR